MQEKWRVKLAKSLEGGPLRGIGAWPAFKRFCERYAMFMVPFITVLREGLEAVVFIAGVSFSAPATAVPLPVIVGLIAGCAVGYIIYKSVSNSLHSGHLLTVHRGGASSKLQLFLIVSTCILYLVAAGLFSRGIWFIQAQQWNKAIGGDAAETGSGPGSYDIDQSVWHVNVSCPNNFHPHTLTSTVW